MLELKKQIVTVAIHHEFRSWQTQTLEFNVMTENSEENAPQRFHIYRASMWVPPNLVGEWTARIKAGAEFEIEGARWASKERTSKFDKIKTYTINELRLDYKQVQPVAEVASSSVGAQPESQGTPPF